MFRSTSRTSSTKSSAPARMARSRTSDQPTPSPGPSPQRGTSMSQRRRRRTSPQSSPRLSLTSNEAAPVAQPDPQDVEIRYAMTDDDVIAIHRFLLMVARPAMRCEPDIEQSLLEIIRVTKYEAALMAVLDGNMVGTMGIMKASWWYNPRVSFMTDRWHFVLPQFWHGPVDKALKGEAIEISRLAGFEFVDQGKTREAKDGSLLMMPRIYPVPNLQRSA